MSYIRYVYDRIHWLNKSESMTTPLGKLRLNHMDSAIYNIAENLDVTYNEMSTGKLDKSDADKLIVGMPTWNSETGVLAFSFYDETTFQVDFNIEKIPVSFSMDSAGVITMKTADGTEWTADIGDVIPTYTYEDSDTIAFSDAKDGDYGHTVSANVKKGSIKEEHLQPNYLSDIKKESSAAKASSESASNYADDAAYDAKLAQSYAIGGSGVRDGEATDNAKYYKEQAASSATTAAQKANAASTFATNAANSATTADTKATESSSSASLAATSATNAASSATTAAQKANAASTSATNAANSATSAAESASTASTKAAEASNSAVQSQSYATGATNSSKYYYEQAKEISESFSGALRPMGTVTFANLPALSNASEGDMYNISDQFTTNANFKEGSGLVISAGANVYKTADGKWDILAGTPVTGVKGNTESAYRKGNVNITKENIGLENVGNYKAVSTVASQGLTDTEKANARENIGALSTSGGTITGYFVKKSIPSGSPGEIKTTYGEGFKSELSIPGSGTVRNVSFDINGLTLGGVTASGIDETPGGTEGSSDLITSGAVYDSLPKVVHNLEYSNVSEVVLGPNVINSGKLYFIQVGTQAGFSNPSCRALIIGGFTSYATPTALYKTEGLVEFTFGTAPNSVTIQTTSQPKITKIKIIELA